MYCDFKNITKYPIYFMEGTFLDFWISFCRKEVKRDMA